MLAERVSEPSRNLENRELEKRVADADIVIEGQVSSIHLPRSQSHAALSSRATVRPVSEHDPKWREAVIDISVVHKGKPAAKQVVVRFPSSTDVQWHRAPKFHTGDRGVWLLTSLKENRGTAKVTRRSETKAEPVTATAIPEATVYSALHPLDFQPVNKVDRVASVIRTAVAAKVP
jgi:hypothetical protein